MNLTQNDAPNLNQGYELPQKTKTPSGSDQITIYEIIGNHILLDYQQTTIMVSVKTQQTQKSSFEPFHTVGHTSTISSFSFHCPLLRPVNSSFYLLTISHAHLDSK